MISARDHVLAFFVRNPDESLTVKDMATKFDVSVYSAWEALRTLRKDGLITKPQRIARSRSFEYRPTRALLALGA